MSIIKTALQRMRAEGPPKSSGYENAPTLNKMKEKEDKASLAKKKPHKG